uniref:Uncharacterized protein n=1 Tax=Podoviridae sp. ctwJH20 TaxID=2827753 RepID=A0A8S5TBZ8_9CAUD|nr:MAG TPA: hypothetical protein [Podoviridae sp. ctwJH20]
MSWTSPLKASREAKAAPGSPARDSPTPTQLPGTTRP